MRRRRVPVKMVRQISLDPQPQGTSAVYLVETRSEDEAREIAKLFQDLKLNMEVRQLARGKLMSFVVQTRGADCNVLSDLEKELKNSFGFVVMQRSFDALIYRIVKELAADTGSKLLPIPHCNICGKPEPFPEVVINLSGSDGETLASRNYCSTCTAGTAAKSNKDFVISLLTADETGFSCLSPEQLIRSRTRKQSIRYKIKTGSEEQCAVTN